MRVPSVSIPGALFAPVGPRGHSLSDIVAQAGAINVVGDIRHPCTMRVVNAVALSSACTEDKATHDTTVTTCHVFRYYTVDWGVYNFYLMFYCNCVSEIVNVE